MGRNLRVPNGMCDGTNGFAEAKRFTVRFANIVDNPDPLVVVFDAGSIHENTN